MLQILYFTSAKLVRIHREYMPDSHDQFQIFTQTIVWVAGFPLLEFIQLFVYNNVLATSHIYTAH
jgi:hypothetical protein